MQKVIGHVAVDSGQVMIGDPCYLSDWTDNNGDFTPGKNYDFSYRGACNASLSDEGYGVLNFPMGHAGAALACGTRWGDGQYPVTATFDESGRVISLTIDFDWDGSHKSDDLDEEVMDECERCGEEAEMGTLDDGYCESCAAIYTDEEDES